MRCVIISIIIMTKSTTSKAKKTPAKKVGGRASKTLNTRKVEEVKLGKFSDCEPLRLPEVPPRRIWQIIGGAALLLIGIFCVATMVADFPFAYLWRSDVEAWQPDQSPLTISWIVNNVALVLFTILCVMSSILLFAKRRVPVGVWYLLIVTLAVGFISQSVGIYANYTNRDCEMEACPLVVGELSTVLLCDLTIFMLSLVVLWMVYKTNLHYGHPKPKRQKR